MTTTAEMLEEHNTLASLLGEKPLKSWKQSKDGLQERIDALRAKVQDTADDAPKPIKQKAAKPSDEDAPQTIGSLVKELLVDPAGLSYDLIVEAVQREFPEAKTSRRSVASVAADLRRKGTTVPMRKKGRPQDAKSSS